MNAEPIPPVRASQLPAAADADVMDADMVLRTIQLLYEKGAAVELRALGVPSGRLSQTWSGYFDNSADLVTGAKSLVADGASGTYVTLNSVDPRLLARRANRVVAIGSGEATGDKDILRRRWFLIDFDAARPAGISSTDEEHAAALARARDVRHVLRGLGWPEPILADSGNGAHLIYKLDLPAADGGLVKRVLAALAMQFGDDRIVVDQAVHNPARLTKLYGTPVRKGDNTPERPHRRSCLVEVPEDIKLVAEPLLQQLARGGGETAQVPAASSVEVVGAWLTANEATFTHKNWQGGDLFILDTCPFNVDHIKTAQVGVQPSGARFFKCFHSSCADQKWHALTALWRGAPKSAAAGPNGEREPVNLWPAMADGFTKPDWVVEDMLVAGEVHLLFGPPGKGKTILAIHAMASVVKAGGVVLFIDEEMGERRVARRMADMGLTEDEVGRIRYLAFPGYQLNEGEEFMTLLRAQEPALVVFDPLADLLAGTGLDEDKAGDVTKWMRTFAIPAAIDAEAAVLILDHPPKADPKTPRGSGAKMAKVDVAFELQVKVPVGIRRLGVIELLTHKNRPGIVEERTRWTLGVRDGVAVLKREALEPSASPLWEAATRLLETLKKAGASGMSNTELQVAAGLGHSRISEQLKLLREQGLVEQFGVGRTARYRVSSAPEGNGSTGNGAASIVPSDSPPLSTKGGEGSEEPSSL